MPQGRKPVIHPLGEVVDLPLSAARIPKASANLTGIARECWNDVVREMVAKNIYDGDSRDMVEAYCIQRARFIEACEHVNNEGQMSKTMKSNVMKYNPWLGISNVAFINMVRLAGELGLTPVSRNRTRKIKGVSSASPAAKFLKSGTQS